MYYPEVSSFVMHHISQLLTRNQDAFFRQCFVELLVRLKNSSIIDDFFYRWWLSCFFWAQNSLAYIWLFSRGCTIPRFLLLWCTASYAFCQEIKGHLPPCLQKSNKSHTMSMRFTLICLKSIFRLVEIDSSRVVLIVDFGPFILRYCMQGMREVG